MPWNAIEEARVICAWEELCPCQPTTRTQREAFARACRHLTVGLACQALATWYATDADGYRPTAGRILTIARDLAADAVAMTSTRRVLSAPAQHSRPCDALGRAARDVVATWRARDVAEAQPPQAPPPRERRRDGVELVRVAVEPRGLAKPELERLRRLAFRPWARAPRGPWTCELPAEAIPALRGALAELVPPQTCYLEAPRT